MNGKCSEEGSDSADRETLVHQPSRGSSFADQYSVSPLPESPSVNGPRLLAYDGNPGSFDQSDGGTLKRELNQHMINSTGISEGTQFS